MLSSIAYHILVALGDGRAHGYAIMQEVAARTDGKVQILPGTLYSTIKKLVGEGLIEECPLRQTRTAPMNVVATTV